MRTTYSKRLFAKSFARLWIELEAMVHIPACYVGVYWKTYNEAITIYFTPVPMLQLQLYLQWGLPF